MIIPNSGDSQINPEIETHIENFRTWLQSRATDDTARLYTSCLEAFYRNHNLSRPIDPENPTLTVKEKGENNDTISLNEAIPQFITNSSKKYALNKYFEWLRERTPSAEEEQTIVFLKNKIQSATPSTTQDDIEEKVISPQKVVDIINAVDYVTNSSPWETMLAFQFMYETAARRKEVAEIEWRDILIEELNEVQLSDTEVVIRSERSKSASTGIVEISEETASKLDQHRKDADCPARDDRVFFADMKLSSARQKLYKEFKKAARHANTDASPHWFRHSRLTHLGRGMLQEEHDYPYVKERLRRYARHESADTTEIYIELLKQQNQELVSKYSPVSWNE